MIYAILADDSTGAADAGVEFVRAGWRTRSLRHNWQPHHLAGAEMIVVDTHSRTTDVETARTAVHQAVARLRQAGGEVVYKKIDSTLRGALGAELEAALAACSRQLAVVCPAFPAAGRTLIDGVLQVGGVAVAHTPAGRDPLTPVHESHLPTLLAGQSQRPVYHFPRPPGGFDPATLVPQWQKLLAANRAGCLAVVDAADDDDLAQIALTAGSLPAGELLLCGSAGLARPWARVLAQQVRRQVLVLCGSLHPMARHQLHALRGQSDSQVCTVLATAEKPPPGTATHQAAETLAAEAIDWLERHAASAVIVIGGDTLEAFLAAAGASGIDLERPLSAGVPLGRLAGGPWAGLRVVSKAGGFGEEDAILQALRQLAPKEE